MCGRIFGDSAPPVKSEKFTGALLVASAMIAVIRLRGEDIRPSPKVRSVVADSVTLAHEVLREIQVAFIGVRLKFSPVKG